MTPVMTLTNASTPLVEQTLQKTANFHLLFERFHGSRLPGEANLFTAKVLHEQHVSAERLESADKLQLLQSFFYIRKKKKITSAAAAGLAMCF